VTLFDSVAALKKACSSILLGLSQLPKFDIDGELEMTLEDIRALFKDTAGLALVPKEFRYWGSYAQACSSTTLSTDVAKGGERDKASSLSSKTYLRSVHRITPSTLFSHRRKPRFAAQLPAS